LLISDNEKEVIRRLIDEETGLLIEIHKGDKLQIISPKQMKAINKSIKTKELNEQTKEWNNQLGGFIFVLFQYCDLILEEHKDITPEDITKLFYLATYVDYDGFLICENDFMTKDIMMKILKVKKRRFDTFFKRMKDAGIFIYQKKILKINAEYFIKGEMSKEIQVNNNYSRIYIDSIRFVYENTFSIISIVMKIRIAKRTHFTTGCSLRNS
jgi:hypothetical protein